MNNLSEHRGGGSITLIRRVVALVILAGAVVGGIIYWQQHNHAPQVVNSQASQQAVPVTTVKVEPLTIPLRPEYLGQAEALQTVEIRARVTGFLDSMHFVEGEHVKEGQLLFSIDPRSFQADLDLARARLASAEAQLVRADQKVKRYTKLEKSKAATRDELEQWQTEELVAQANIKMEKARITQAELDLGYTSVESPIDGRIGMALRDVGSFVDSSSNGLLAVVQKIDPIYVRFNVSEKDLLEGRRLAESGKTSQALIKNIRLQIVLADGAVFPHEGTITYTDPDIDTSTGTMVMRGTVPNPDGTLMPGQFVHVRLLGLKRLNALLVPKTAVLQNPTGAMVYVADADGKAEIRAVTLGPWQGDQWIVETGLNPGDEVITDKLMQIRPGMPVIPTQAKAQGGETQSNRTSGEM